MSGYIGVLPVPQTTQTRESFTATAGQTSFGTSGYQIDHLDVYLNGVKLAAADYTATNGSDIVLASGAAVNDILEMVAFETFTIANQSFTGTTTVDTLVVTNTVDGRDVSVDGAKLDTIPIISTSSTPSFTAKGDGTTDGYIQLNCSQNSHGIKLKSPPHSANASYTLTFPNDDGNAGQFLKTNGSGVLSWATDSTTDSTKLPLAGGAMTGPITTNSTFDGRDVATDGTKLDGIEASADVTDTTNVTAAGALMDSELTNLAAVKAINQSLVTTASPTFAGMATTANVTFGDNDKAVFGAGSDLQIYHTGTDSIIQEAVNNRRFLIGGDEIAIRKGDLSEDMAKFTADGAVELYHNNVKTFETTATGIDVTGTVSANGLIIEDGGSATNSLDITYSGSSGQANIQVDSNGGNTFLTFGTSQSGTVAERMRIDASGNVGIGTSAPVTKIHIAGNSSTRNQIVSNVTIDGGNNVSSPYDGFGFGIDFIGRDYGNATRYYAAIKSVMENQTSSSGGGDAGFKSNLRFYTNGGGASNASISERMRVTAAGDFLIGSQSVIDAGAGTQDGFSFSAGDRADFSRNNNPPLDLRRRSSDGAIVNLYKDTTNVGSIFSGHGGSQVGIGTNTTGITFNPSTRSMMPANPSSSNPQLDATLDIGYSSVRWRDLYLSGGVQLGGSGAPNKLSYYEEGTWSPVLSGAGGGTKAGIGSYVIIGKTVTVSCTFNAIGTGLSGNLSSNLPVTPNPQGGLDMYVPVQWFSLNWTSGALAQYGFIPDGTATLTPYCSKDAASSQVIQGDALSSITYMRFVITYETA